VKSLSHMTWLMVLNSVVLLGGGTASYAILSYKVEAGVSSPGSEAVVKSGAPEALPIEDDAIRSNPIFRRSRQALGGGDTAAANADVPQPPPPPPSPLLVGVLRGPGGQHWALLESQGRASRRLLSKGGEFEGWRIQRIGAKDVSLHHAESRSDVDIRLPNATIDAAGNKK